MAIYYPISSGQKEWQEHNVCKVCKHKAELNESMRVLVFDAKHKYYLCWRCLDRFIAAHWNDDENDMEDMNDECEV